MWAKRFASKTACVSALVLAWGLASICCGQGAQGDDTRSQFEAAERELQKLIDGEGAPSVYLEYMKLKEALDKQEETHRAEILPTQKRLGELWKDEEFEAWRDKIQQASFQLGKLRRELEKDLQQRGQVLQERRREELAAIAVKAAPEARAIGFTIETYPVVDGSTSTRPLGMIIACKFLGSRYEWVAAEKYSGNWDIAGRPPGAFEYEDFLRTPGLPIEWVHDAYHPDLTFVSFRPIAIPADPPNQEDARRSVVINHMLNVHAGTHGAYENVIAGKSDIGLIARRPSSDELALAKTENIELEVTPIAMDAFVFLKNYENPVAGLSTDQIKQIYSGELVKWSEVGGPDEKITAYRRDKHSGSQELMETLVMKDASFASLHEYGEEYIVRGGMGGPYIALTSNKWGIGYSVYYYEHFMAASPNTELLAVDGVMPSFATIQAGEYPYVTEVYAVIRRDAGEDSGAVKIRDWLMAPEGQGVIRESGYVPLATG
ncbi:MAG: substrate-binding domain-containing protein [Candidatus Hydrogenedentes bacterium]|nr:substrate-binding domain-containing protein [Candidatus Hydrogenedentota bacterium]